MPKRSRASPLSYVPTDELMHELGRRCQDIAIFVNSRYQFSGFQQRDTVKYMISNPPAHTNFIPAVRNIILSLDPPHVKS
jgi:hypothetical protein